MVFQKAAVVKSKAAFYYMLDLIYLLDIRIKNFHHWFLPNITSLYFYL
jgi:hypothetical protein